MARRNLAPPTLQYLLAMRTTLQALYKAQDDQIDRHRRVRCLDQAVPIDDIYRLTSVEVRDPTIWDEDQHVAAMFSINPPKCKVTPANPGTDSGEEDATLREKWTEEVFKRAGRSRPGMDAFTAAVDACVGDGGAWSKLVFDKDMWDERYRVRASDSDAEYDVKTEEAKKAAGPPFRWIVPDVRTIYPLWTNGHLDEVLEVQRRPLYATLRQYQLALDGAGNLIKDVVPDLLGEPTNQFYPQLTGEAYVDFLEHWTNTTCFPAGTRVRSEGDLVGASKRWYKGNVVQVRTAGGHDLTGTPNHAVLTQRGWVALGELVEGDRVVCRALGQGVGPAAPDEQDAQPLIQQVFEALARCGRVQRGMGTERDFHGDGQDGDINIVWADGLLADWLKAPISQPAGEVRLAAADAGAAAILADAGPVCAGGGRLRSSKHGAVHRVGLPGALLGGHAGVAQSRRGAVVAAGDAGSREATDDDAIATAVRTGDGGRGLAGQVARDDLRLVDAEALPALLGVVGAAGAAHDLDATGHGNARVAEAVRDHVMRDAERARDGAQRLLADGVAFDDVVHVEVQWFAGHVYNLQTGNDWYYANNIIAHNCTYAVVGSNTAGQFTGQMVAQWKHGYGRVPYFYAPGISVNWWVNRKVGWPVSEAKRWLVEYRAFLETVLANVAARDTLAPLKLTTAPGSLPAQGEGIVGNDQRPTQPERWDLKTIIRLAPGQDLVPLAFPAVADSVREELARVDARIKELSTPHVEEQLAHDLAGAGFAISAVLTEIRIRHGGIARSLQLMLEEMTYFCWSLVRRKIKETVWVRSAGTKGGWLGAGPDDLTPNVGVTWELDPELPSTKLIEWRLMHERLAAKTVDIDTALSEMGENPDEIRRGLMLDWLRQQPWYLQALQLHTLQTIQRGDLLAHAAEAQAIVATGARPTPGGMGTAQVPDLGQAAAPANGAVGAGASPLVGPGPGQGMPGAAPVPAAAGAGGMVAPPGGQGG